MCSSDLCRLMANSVFHDPSGRRARRAGLALALVMGLAVYAFYHDDRLAWTMGLAIIANLFVASLAGILAPIVLERFGRDPAVSSSVLVTFATDFMGFLALLGIASLILL